jgi:hypothetical protein
LVEAADHRSEVRVKLQWYTNLAIDQFGGGFFLGITYLRRQRALTFFVGARMLTFTF